MDKTLEQQAELDRVLRSNFRLSASIGNVLRRAVVFRGPFLAPEDIRYFRFEQGTTCTDDPEEMERRSARAEQFRARLKRLLG